MRWARAHGHLLLAGVMTFLLSFRGIDALPLSHDEFYTLHALERGLSEHTWEAPLLPYYALLWLWTIGGSHTSDLMMRSLSVVAMSATAVVTAAIAATVSSRRSGYFAGLLVALSTSVQFFAHTARPYAVGAMIFTGSMYFLIRGISEPNRKRWWLLYPVSLLVGIVVMPQGLAVVAAQALYVASGRPSAAIVKRWALALGTTAPLIVTGLLLVRFSSYPNMHSWLAVPGVLKIPADLVWLGDVVPTPTTAAYGFGMVVLGLSNRKGQILVGGAFASLIALWLGSHLGVSFWLGASFVPLIPLVAAGAAIALGELVPQLAIPAMIAFVLVAIPGYTAIRMSGATGADMRLVAQIIEDNSVPDASLFGDRTDAFGLYPAMRRYGRAPFAGDVNLSPVGVHWSLVGDEACKPLNEWDVGGDTKLRLCAAPD